MQNRVKLQIKSFQNKDNLIKFDHQVIKTQNNFTIFFLLLSQCKYHELFQ